MPHEDSSLLGLEGYTRCVLRLLASSSIGSQEMGNVRVGTHTDRHAHTLTTRQQKEKRVNGKNFRRQCREEILKPPDVR